MEQRVTAPGDSALSAGRDAREPALRVRLQLRELAVQLRDDLETLADPQAKALFGTTADLLTTLEQAFAGVDARTEAEAASAPWPRAGH